MLSFLLGGCASSYVAVPEPCTPVEGVTLDAPEMDGKTLRDFVAEVEGDYLVHWDGNVDVADSVLSFPTLDLDLDAMTVCSKEDDTWGQLVSPIVSTWSVTGDVPLRAGAEAWFSVLGGDPGLLVLGEDPVPDAWVPTIEASLDAADYDGPVPSVVQTRIGVGISWGGGISIGGPPPFPEEATSLAWVTAQERLP